MGRGQDAVDGGIEWLYSIKKTTEEDLLVRATYKETNGVTWHVGITFLAILPL